MAWNQVVNLGIEKMTAKMPPTMSKGWTQAVSRIHLQKREKAALRDLRMYMVDLRTKRA